MVDRARAQRLAKRIVTIVATELQHQVKDPRLAMVTVTAATVTPDLRDAKVFYTVYGEDDEVAATAAALSSATGVLRSAVGQQTGIKFTPTLTFELDTVPETVHRIDELIAAARDADAEVAQRAAGASYAGDADPYRTTTDGDGETAAESAQRAAGATYAGDGDVDGGGDGGGRGDTDGTPPHRAPAGGPGHDPRRPSEFDGAAER